MMILKLQQRSYDDFSAPQNFPPLKFCFSPHRAQNISLLSFLAAVAFVIFALSLLRRIIHLLPFY